MIEITTKGLRSVQSNICLNEKRIGNPFRIIQQLSCDGKETIKGRKGKKLLKFLFGIRLHVKLKNGRFRGRS